MRRLVVLGPWLLMLACGSEAVVEPPAPTVPAAPRSPEPPPSDVATLGLAIASSWRDRAPMVDTLLVGEVYETQDHWSIGEVSGEASSGLTIRMRSPDREAAFEAVRARLEGHDARYSTGGNTVSARVDRMSVRASMPSFFPGELHVDVAGGATREEVVAQCRRLVLLPAELATLNGWPGNVRSCTLTLRLGAPPSSGVSLHVDEAVATLWLRERGFSERPARNVELLGRSFERVQEPLLRATWHARTSELSVFVGVHEEL